jgi:hypothetical protein
VHRSGFQTFQAASLLFLSIKDEQTKKVWRSGISVSLFPAWTGFHSFHRCFCSLVTPDLPKLLALDLRPAELAFFASKRSLSLSFIMKIVHFVWSELGKVGLIILIQLSNKSSTLSLYFKHLNQ